MEITARAKELKAQGHDVISFAAGEPCFRTPSNIVDAAVKYLRSNESLGYTHVAGVPRLRQAIADYLDDEYGIEYEEQNIATFNGGKDALDVVFLTLINPGDKVLVPKPYWVSIPEMIQQAQGVPVFVECDDDFQINIDHLRELLNDDEIIGIYLNSPNNPSGAVYTQRCLCEVGKLVREKKLWVVSDEIYDKIVYTSDYPSFLKLHPDLFGQTVIVNGASKAYAMTGWRMGYAAGPEHFIRACIKKQGQRASNISIVTQVAAIEAYTADASFVAIEEMKEEYRRRRDLMVELLNDIDGWECVVPQGAFYAFPRILRSHGFVDDENFAKELLESAHVALVPGTSFGMPGHVRLSYACSIDDILAGVKRIKTYFER
jgi:aspartate aminotransferase